MLVKIQYRRGTTTEWAEADPILSLGEPGYDTTLLMTKVGDGVSHWSELEFQSGGGGGGGNVGYVGLPAGVTITIDYDDEDGWPDLPDGIGANLRVVWTGGDEAHPPGDARVLDKWDRPVS